MLGKHVLKRRGIVKESQVTLSVSEGVREGAREGGNLWGIEVLTHLKMFVEKFLLWNKSCPNSVNFRFNFVLNSH